MLEITSITALRDNYIYLIRESRSQTIAVVDPGDAAPVEKELKKLGYERLDYIFLTHHHWDHTDGVAQLKDTYGCQVLGASYDRHRIRCLDDCYSDGDEFRFGQERVKVIHVPGHTSGHVALHFIDEAALFPGDTLFSAGCGRLFEGSPAQMWASLRRLRLLPDDCGVYCAHEYTADNLRFAASIEPENKYIAQHQIHVKDLIDKGQPSLPSTIGLEKKINPFFRADLAVLRSKLDANNLSDVEVFAMLRAKKDSFN